MVQSMEPRPRLEREVPGEQRSTGYPAGLHQVGCVSDLMINMDAWKKLPPDLQAVVENAAMANMVWSYAKANWDAIEASEKFKAAGIQESRLDQQAQDKLEELCTKFMKWNPVKPGLCEDRQIHSRLFETV